MDSLTVINSLHDPALDKVGKGFEAGTVFLPQLLMSAEAAKSAFEVIKNQMESSRGSRREEGQDRAGDRQGRYS